MAECVDDIVCCEWERENDDKDGEQWKSENWSTGSTHTHTHTRKQCRRSSRWRNTEIEESQQKLNVGRLADWVACLLVISFHLLCRGKWYSDFNMQKNWKVSTSSSTHTTSIHRGWPTRSLCHCSSDADSWPQSIDRHIEIESEKYEFAVYKFNSFFVVVCFSRNNGLCPTVSTWIGLHTTHTWPILWRADGGQTTSRRSNHILKWIESIWNEVNRPSETKQYFFENQSMVCTGIDAVNRWPRARAREDDCRRKTAYEHEHKLWKYINQTKNKNQKSHSIACGIIARFDYII